MRKVVFLVILSISLLHFARTQEKGFDQPYVPEAVNVSAPGDNYIPEMSFNYIDSPLADIVWCGEQKNVIFFLTEKSTLYRSVDDGFTGHLLSDHLQKLAKSELDSPKEEVQTP